MPLWILRLIISVQEKGQGKRRRWFHKELKWSKQTKKEEPQQLNEYLVAKDFLYIYKLPLHPLCHRPSAGLNIRSQYRKKEKKEEKEKEKEEIRTWVAWRILTHLRISPWPKLKRPSKPSSVTSTEENTKLRKVSF